MTDSRSRASGVALAAMLALSACGPKAPALAGHLAPNRLPSADLPREHRKIVFRWQYRDNDFTFSGDGVARIAGPDSARLDFFLAGGMGGGWAVLIGDRLRTPGGDFVASFLPKPPLLWATLGRLRLPAERDTMVRVDGDTLRADIGQDPRWRGTFVGDSLRRLERIDGGRLAEWVHRAPSGVIRYRHETARRELEISIQRTEPATAFDEEIWR